MTSAVSTCSVCRTESLQPFLSVDGKDYWRCTTCEARLLDPRHHLSREDEYAQYLDHQNDPEDRRYRRFLAKLAGPLLQRLDKASRGLDYGCGPGPALAAMLRESGHDMALYDPFFYPDRDVLLHRYDFVTCTETAEHFHRPADEFERLFRMVRPGGWLAIMTRFLTDDAKFGTWHYRMDPTHVVFYREETFQHLARIQGWSCEIPADDIALMQRPHADPEKAG